MSIKLTLRDEYWYIDVRWSPAAPFKSHSRHPTLDKAIAKIKEISREGVAA